MADHGFDAIPALVVAVEHDGKVGIGEAPAFRVTRYNSELSTMRAALEDLRPWLATTEPGPPGPLWPALRAQLAEHPFVLHAVDVALWDLWGKLQDRTVRALLGTDGPVRTVTAYSIGLDEPRTMLRKMHDRPDWPIYKIKVAGPEHLDTLALLRSETDAPFYVDGNCSWQPKDILAALGAMAELGVTLLEQPLPIPLWDEMRDVRKEAAFPVIADESVTSAGDVPRCRDGFDGVNIKLPKLGGLSPAMDTARTARAQGLAIMVGCMPESTVGISATAQLAAWADHLDMDSALLLQDDPATGVAIDDEGHVRFSPAPGTGARLRPEVWGLLSLA
ncbi:dipeptide epimerase [Streptomyces sp. 150FB]|uniref:dipeptide epimerase n=1 Tax=Streptomyces sp. 150FB TaxID=1576605 RepID=UPI00136492D1|nr:dipeptide epimerase [Streptomyces sp. 150FB]